MEDPPYFVQYIMATIKVPMIRQPSGKIDSLSDHTTIDFETIRGLPLKPDYKVDNAYIKQKINELLRQKNREPIGEEVVEPLTQIDEEIVEKPVEELVPQPEEEPVDEPVLDEPIVEPIDVSIDEALVDVSIDEPVDEPPVLQPPSHEEQARIIEETAAMRLRNLGAKFLLNDKKKSSSKKVLKERSPSPEFSMRK